MLPPLLLDDDEAVAVAISLRSAAGGTVGGLDETALRALVKLEQVLPNRLRHRLTALHAATVTTSPNGPAVDAATLATLAAACRESQTVRLEYRGHTGTETQRTVQPHRLVHNGRRWFLVAWDTDRDDWRTFRVDRMRLRSPAGPRFTPREVSDSEVVADPATGHIVSAPAHGDGQALVACEADGGDHVGDTRAARDESWALVHHALPHQTGLVAIVVRRPDEPPTQPGLQLTSEIVPHLRGHRAGSFHGHLLSLLWSRLVPRDMRT